MDKRIFGLETEYGVTCAVATGRGLSARRGRAVPVPQGGGLGAVVERLPAQRVPALPGRRLAPRVRDRRVRLAAPARRSRPRRGAGPRGAGGGRPAAPGGRGRARHDPPVQEQHRLGRQLVRLPRELPGAAQGGLRPDRRRAGAVPHHPPGADRGRQGAAHPARGDLHACPSAPTTSGSRSPARPPVRARSSTRATSRTPTPSSTAGCTSSSATPRCPRPPRCSRSARPT